MPVPSELLVFARDLRGTQTDAENLLWSLLRNRRFCGFKFRRQYPLGGYIVDFYCHQARLVIEIDGAGHNATEQWLYDEGRTQVIEAAGNFVVRFWNNEVLNNLEVVLEQTYSELMIRAKYDIL